MKKYILSALTLSIGLVGCSSGGSSSGGSTYVEPNQTSDLTDGGTVTYLTTPETISPNSPLNTMVKINGTSGVQYTVSYSVSQSQLSSSKLNTSNVPSIATQPSPCVITGSGFCQVSINTNNAYNGDYSIFTNVYVNGKLVSNNTPFSITVTNSPIPSEKHYAYVTNTYGNQVLMYSVNSADGSLTPLSPANISVPQNVSGNLTKSPIGNYLYATTYNPNTYMSSFYLYNINISTGQLEYNSNYAGGDTYSSNNNLLTFDPSGNYAYYTGGDSFLINYYIPQGNGGLTPDGSSGGGQSQGSYYSYLTFTHSGQYAFLLGTDNQISMNTINSSGKFESIVTTLTASNPNYHINHMTITPNDKFAYVSSPNNSDNSSMITMFTINNSSFAPLSPESVVNAPGYPIGMTTDLNGKYLYVANHYTKNITIYQINQSTGALTLLPGSPVVSTTSFPEGIKLGPDGRHIYVTYYNFDVDGNPGGVLVYQINSDGSLTQTSSVNATSPNSIVFY